MHYHGRANFLPMEKPTSNYLSNIPPGAWSGYNTLWFWMLRIWIWMSLHPMVISVVNKLVLVACKLILKQVRLDCIYRPFFMSNLQHNMQLDIGCIEHH